MQILNGVLERGDINKNARGGTELMAERLVRDVAPEVLKDFQIIISRVQHELDPTKIRVYYCHDLPDDPASAHLANEGWKKFHKLVFVSNWQMQQYIAKFDIPWGRCAVMQNAIEPIRKHDKPTDTLNLAYWSTPHRGLNLAVSVFDKLCEDYDNVHFNVYSSFNLYGWGERDEEFKELFEFCREHPKITYHGSIPNEDLREELCNNHILLYPSTWVETSCLVLMEAMSAGIVPIHSNLGALYETAANWTFMYQTQEDPQHHCSQLHTYAKYVIDHYNEDEIQSQVASAKTYADVFYNWSHRAQQWESLLVSLQGLPTELEASADDILEFDTTA